MKDNNYFMRKAEERAKKSTCCSRSVGAVLVKDNKIIVSGYNGVPTKITHPTVCIRNKLNIPSGTRLELSDCVHAEVNCILQCAKYGICCMGTILFSTVKPCADCTKMILNSGILGVFYREDYQMSSEFNFINEMVKESGVFFQKI